MTSSIAHHSTQRCQLAIFISGGGSNLQAIIDNIEQGHLAADIICVISDQPDAYGLERAKKHGLNAHYINPKDFASKHDYELALIECLSINQQSNYLDLIILAGFMRILSPTFVNHYKDKILNIHPSLLPKYKGLNTHQRAIDNGDKTHGSTVHIVTAELDDGPILLQSTVNIEPNDNVQTLQDKVQQKEYLLYTKAIQSFWQQRSKSNNDC